jgi:hypothetical protein
MGMGNIDWKSDDWFDAHYSHLLTPEFEQWWVGFYGTPEDYVASMRDFQEGDPGQHEYFIRAAFALNGWRAARGDPNLFLSEDDR